jgi:intraflagellar transport protein 122
VDKKDFPMAYSTGCLGVTESDWRQLGREAVHTLDLRIARKAFTRLKVIKRMSLVTADST